MAGPTDTDCEVTENFAVSAGDRLAIRVDSVSQFAVNRDVMVAVGLTPAG